MYPALPNQYANAVHRVPWLNYFHGPGFRNASNAADTHRAISGARRAHGVLKCKSKAEIAVIGDNSYFYLGAAVGSGVFFAYDTMGDGVPGGYVAIPLALWTTEDEVAAATAEVINASSLRIAASSSGAQVFLRNLDPGKGAGIHDADAVLTGWWGMSDEYGVGPYPQGVLGYWPSGGFDGDDCVPIRWGLQRGMAPDTSQLS